MAPKKKAPKQPKRVEVPPPPKTMVDEIVDVIVGRGLRPLSLWFAAILLPGVLTVLIIVPLEWTLTAVVSLCGLMFWTVPFDQLARFLINIGNLRECLADCAPYAPGMLPYLPEMLRVMIPNIFKLAPAAGPLAPYLKYLLKYPDFVAKALPILVPKIDLMLKYNMIEQLGPQFKYMDRRHLDKLEIILQPMMDDLENLAPYFHIIAPHIVEISLRADKLFPVINYLLPHAEDMKQHIWWLIPFADVDGFEEFMPHLDRLAPHIDEFAPYGPDLLPYMAKMKKHIPILLDNVESLLPQLGEAVDYMDPLVYWLSDLLPLANSVGVLKSKFMLKMGMPFLKFLPGVPADQVTRRPKPSDFDPDAFRREESRRLIRIPRSHVVDGAVFYVVNVDGRYAGEFRYSSLRELHDIVSRLAGDLGLKDLPPFPGKHVMGMNDQQREERRAALERFLQYVLAEPLVVETPDFIDFVKQHRRWEQDLPILVSPLLAAANTGKRGGFANGIAK